MSLRAVKIQTAEEISVKTPIKRPVVLQLHRAIEEETRHFLLGQVLRRIREFDLLNNPEADGKVHARAVEWDFAQDQQDQRFFIVVAVKDARIVGHLLAKRLENYG